MPIPLAIPAVLGGLAALGGGATAAVQTGFARATLKRHLNKNRAEIEKWALANVFERLGLPNLIDGKLDRASFTAAINQNLLAGQQFQFSDVFDKKTIVNDALKYSLMQIAEQHPDLTPKDWTYKGMREAIQDYVQKMLEDEILREELGELTQDAKDIKEILDLYKEYKLLDAANQVRQEEGKKPVIATPEAKSNRERQARYRANHKKVWTEKGAATEGAENGEE